MILSRQTHDVRGLYPSRLRYNPAMFLYQNKTFMVYRCQNSIRGVSWLSVSELDHNLNAVGYKRLQTPTKTAEDPRVVVVNKLIYVFFNSGSPDFPKKNPYDFHIYVAIYDSEFNLLDCRPTTYKDRRDCEKNWIFFNSNGWKCIYSYNPWKVLAFDDQWRGELAVSDERKLPWRYGEVRGGTTPVYMPLQTGFSFGEQKPQVYTMFHSRYNPVKELKSPAQYVAGLISFGVDLKPTGISTEPIMHPVQPHRTAVGSHVVFPCGLIKKDYNWLVSYGSGDCQCKIDTLNHHEITSDTLFERL